MRQLSGQDATFLYLESPGAHLHLTGLYLYGRPPGGRPSPGFDGVRKLVLAMLEEVTELRQKLVRPPLDLDFPVWTDDPEFDPGHHIFRHPGPAPRSRKALFSLVAAIHAEPLDLSRPPWEIHVVDRLGNLRGLPAARFALILKYHHAAIDGASGALLVDRLHGAAALTDTPGRHSGPPPGAAELAARGLLNNIRNACSLGRALGSAAPGIARGLTRRIRAGGTPVPLTRFNAPVDPDRVMHAVQLPQERLRALRTRVPGATTNDVLLALCGGTLRRWLARRSELPGDSLVAMVPVNIRDASEQEQPGNRLATLFLPIGTDRSNPLERLRFVQAETQRAKSGAGGLEPQRAGAIARHLPALPLSVTARLLTGLGLGHRVPRLCNVTITSVPPNRAGLQLGGAPLVYVAGNGPIIDGMGLIISIFRFSDQVSLSFSSCGRMLADPETLARDALRELEAFERAATAA